MIFAVNYNVGFSDAHDGANGVYNCAYDDDNEDNGADDDDEVNGSNDKPDGLDDDDYDDIDDTYLISLFQF